jgi:hypothetical protein
MTNLLSTVVRRVIERCTRDWILVRHLPSAFGDISVYVAPSAGLRFIFKPMTKVDPILLRNVTLIRSNDMQRS